jgi:hypothetical protein
MALPEFGYTVECKQVLRLARERITVTAPTAVVDQRLGVGLLDQQHDQVHQPGPEAEAEEKIKSNGTVQESAARPHTQTHDGPFLCVLVLTQIAWLAALGYGAYWLLP